MDPWNVHEDRRRVRSPIENIVVAVGTPAASMAFFANNLEPSNSACTCCGPKQGMSPQGVDLLDHHTAAPQARQQQNQHPIALRD